MEKSISVAQKLKRKTGAHEEKGREVFISQIPENQKADRRINRDYLSRVKSFVDFPSETS